MQSHLEIPRRIKVVDTKKLVDVNLDEMTIESDTGPLTFRLRQKSQYLSGDIAKIFFYVVLHGLNGKRKVSTVSGWINQFELFTRNAAKGRTKPITLLTFAIFNRYVTAKNASQIKLLRSFLLYWNKLKKPGIEPALADYLVTSKSPKPRHTFEIQSAVEKERPFSLQQIRNILGEIDGLYMRAHLTARIICCGD